MKTEWTNAIGKSPAAVDRATGVIYLHPVYFNKLTPFQKKFIYFHEVGHYMLNTSDEIKADGYAFDKLAGTEFRSLKQAVACLPEVLDMSNPTLRPRYIALYKRALEWDYKRGNKEAGEMLSRINKHGLDKLDFVEWEIGLSGIKVNTQSYADQFYKTLQGITQLMQEQGAQRIADVQSRKQQQNMIVLALVGFGLLMFLKD